MKDNFVDAIYIDSLKRWNVNGEVFITEKLVTNKNKRKLVLMDENLNFIACDDLEKIKKSILDNIGDSELSFY